MISILRKDRLSAKPPQNLERLPNLVWGDPLPDSSTERVWMAHSLISDILERSSVVEILFDCTDVWESGRYMPLFETVWNRLSQGEGFFPSSCGILVDSPNSVEVEDVTSIVILGFVFCWDVMCYSNDNAFFYLSHDDYIFGSGLKSLAQIFDKCRRQRTC